MPQAEVRTGGTAREDWSAGSWGLPTRVSSCPHEDHARSACSCPRPSPAPCPSLPGLSPSCLPSPPLPLPLLLRAPPSFRVSSEPPLAFVPR